MEGSYALFIFFGLLAPSILNLGLGMQKWGIDGLAAIKRFFADGRVRAKVIVWVVGTLMTTGSMVVGFAALSQGGNASTLGALAGFGLIVLVLFSFFVLREEITRRELIGILVIMVGTSVMGAFSSDVQTGAVTIHRSGMIWFFAGFALYCAISVVVIKLGSDALRGVIMGVLSGAAGAVGIVFMKVVTEWTMSFAVEREITLLQYLSNPFVFMAFVPGILSFFILQFSYQYGKAVTIVPSMNSALIVVPSLVAMAVLREEILPMQWAALGAIVIGVLLISTPKTQEAPDGMKA